MKVIFLVNDYSRGAGTERAVHNISSIIARYLGEKVEIFSLFKSNMQSFYPETPGITIKWLQLEYQSMPLFYVHFFFTMINALKAEKACVVLGTSHGHSMILPLIDVFLGKNRNFACEHMTYDFAPALSRLARNISYRFLDGVVVLTERESICYRRFAKKVYVAPNPLSFKAQAQPTEKQSNVLLAIGRFTHIKGFDLLLLCVKDFFTTYPDWRLRIVGEGEGKELLCRMISDLDLVDHVTLVPPTKQIELEYQKASILLMTSRTEAFPMVLLEGMAFSLPVVAFDCPFGPRELVEDGANGYLVPMGDIESFSNKIAIIAGNAELRTKMGQNSLRRVERFSDERIASIWREILSEE
jgi:glycosyltransferase involved in cell wall biosynthesis